VLSRELARKLVKLLPLLASEQDGEVAGAARAITRALAADNLDLHDLSRLLTGRASADSARHDHANPKPPHPGETPEERRSEPRFRRVLLTGKILLPNGGIIDCKVRNRSADGALLQLASLIGIPDQFVLRFPSTNEAFGVEIIWRGEREIGVRRI